MIQKKTYNKYLDIFNKIADSGLSINAYLKSIGKDPKSCGFYSTIANIRKHANDGDANAQELVDIYESLLSRECSFGSDEEQGMKWWVDRDDNGTITQYHIHYPVKDSIPFDTTLTRQDCEQIFGLYVYYGGNLTARNVANEFPKYTLTEIKRIFRVFKLTKDSSWACPHLMEELNEEQLAQYRMALKERAAFKYCDARQERDFTNQIKKMASEINKLRDKQELAKQLLNDNSYFNIPLTYEKVSNSSDIVIFLSDLHIGAYNEKEGYISLPDYNENEIIRRLGKVVNYLKSSNYNSITICNLGDSVDSFNKQTTRGGHDLPTIISNKEQSEMYQKIMMGFFNKLVEISPKISYICVGESNHDGDWGWINNIVLAEKLKQLNIKSYISNNPIDKFDINDVSIIFLHGKDNKNQYKGFPLILNEKTENWFLNYMNDSKLTFKSRKCVVKGDLHQYACTCAKTFDYISAPSLYATSNWIAANFGLSRWAVLAMEITNNNIIKQFLIKD